MSSKPTKDSGASCQWLCPTLACLIICISIFMAIDSWVDNKSNRFEPDAYVDLEHVEVSEHEAVAANKTQNLRVAIAPVISPEKSLEAYYDLVKHLGEKVGRPTVLLTGDDYSAVNNLMRLNQCDMALVCTYSFILGERNFDMKLLAIPEIYGQQVYRSYVIAPLSSTCSSLLDFRHRRFASSDVLSTSGWLYPMTWLKSKGMDLESFFSKHLITGSHDRSIQAVRAGVVDGAAVDSLVFEQLLRKDPELKNEVRIIQQSETFGMPPLVIPANLPPGTKDKLRGALLGMHEDSNGKKVLDALSIDRFVEAKTESYESVRQLISDWENKPQG